MQLPWEEVKKEMTQEKGLDPTVADKIGQYVKLKGAGLEGEHYSPVPPFGPDPTCRQRPRNCYKSSCKIPPLRQIRVQRKAYQI